MDHSGPLPASQPRERVFLPPGDSVVEQGYRQCRRLAREAFSSLHWCCSNLPAAEYGAVATLVWHLHRGLELSRHRLEGAVNQDQIAEYRDDLGEAMQGRYVSVELAALADAQQRYGIPLQFLFEFFEGIDWLMRFPPPRDWDGVQSAAARTGGAIMAAAATVLGANPAAAAGPAVALGQALIITYWLDSLVVDLRAGLQRLADSDFAECELEQRRFPSIPMGKPVVWLARLYGHRLEQLLKTSAPLASHLSFDGARVAGALTAICFRAATNLRVSPERLLTAEGILTPADLRRLRLRYFLGLDLEVPFEAPAAHGHH